MAGRDSKEGVKGWEQGTGLLSGLGLHLVGRARAYHGLVGVAELSRAQQAWAVDGNA